MVRVGCVADVYARLSDEDLEREVRRLRRCAVCRAGNRRQVALWCAHCAEQELVRRRTRASGT